MEPYAAVALFALFAVVLGTVVFGGTTLAYFLGKRSPASTYSSPPQHLKAAPAGTRASESTTAPHDAAA